mmetsp:Transcript_15164/g.18127  ORF Transcript_15164/g.18127 Transcript_15164/m.18127 type:complete len:81 (-) Transcript_15164:169-411(-)
MTITAMPRSKLKISSTNKPLLFCRRPLWEIKARKMSNTSQIMAKIENSPQKRWNRKWRYSVHEQHHISGISIAYLTRKKK